MVNVLWILLAFALVLLNAFFVAAEFGMVKLRHTRVAMIKEIYGLRGQILYQVHKNLDAYLSACQLGITLASLGLGWIGEPAFANLLAPLFDSLGVVSPDVISVVSFFVAFILISFLHIVVGELMPKSLAIRQAEKISVWTAVPLYIFYWTMYPAIWLLNSCSNFLLKVLGLTDVHRDEAFYSAKELKLLLGASHFHGGLNKEKIEIIEHSLDFADLKVTEVMRPREEMIILDIQNSIQNIMGTIMQQRYSRYPVYDSKRKEIIGIIHVKDLFSTLYQYHKIKELRPLLRPVLKVSRNLPAIDLLKKFREGMPHFALVYNKPEEIIGFITLDNLLQVLIGRIKDEFHRTQVDWATNSDGSLSVRGDCSLYSLEQALEREIKTDDDTADTLATLIVHKLGGLPTKGQHIAFKQFDVIIDKMQGSRIAKVNVYPKEVDEGDN